MAVVSTGVNLLRWGILTVGVFYGVTHQRTIYKQVEHQKSLDEYKRKESLIAKAKAQYAKLHPPPPPPRGGAIRDPEDPQFDLEALLNELTS